MAHTKMVGGDGRPPLRSQVDVVECEEGPEEFLEAQSLLTEVILTPFTALPSSVLPPPPA